MPPTTAAAVSTDRVNWKVVPIGGVKGGMMRVVFANAENDFPSRIVYERDGDALKARIEGEIGGQAAAIKTGTAGEQNDFVAQAKAFEVGHGREKWRWQRLWISRRGH
jgi:hypothetical protein